MPSSTSEATTTSGPSTDRVRSQNPFIELGAKVFLGADASRVVAIVGCYRGEGVSHISRALASFLSREAGLPCEVMSADAFMAGLADVQAGNASASRDAALLRDAANEPGRVGQSKVILVDCPSLFSSATAIRAIPHVDGTLLVIADGERTKAEVERAATMIEAVQGRLLGAILNRRVDSLPPWLNHLIS